ncbi:MAG: hypothetical protein KGQ32_05240 [Xanthomonadaceae bacterium]|nr:hypothetical protein [Xanthomonadaceae bacterium]
MASMAWVAAGACENEGLAGRVSRATAAVLHAAIASASAVQGSAAPRCAFEQADRTEEHRAVSGWNIAFTLLVIESKIVADRGQHQ